MTSSFTISACEYLNFALFVQDAAGLHGYQGYIGRTLHWPYDDSGFVDATSFSVRAEASLQWTIWWEKLLDIARQEVRQSVAPYELIQDITFGHFRFLDEFPSLQLAAQWSFPRYLSWWTAPYVGGKSAIETHINQQTPHIPRLWEVDKGAALSVKVVYPMKFDCFIESLNESRSLCIVNVHGLYHTEWLYKEKGV